MDSGVSRAALFNESFERCSADSAFLDRFYEYFLSSSTEVQEKFVDTDMTRQKETLLISLSYMMMASTNPELLNKTAVKHNIHNRDIKPHLYELWLESMIKAVEATDERFDSAVESAWRKVLAPGIKYLIERHKP